MSVHKAPGVYVVEVSKLPPSVAEVSTAIPAFIGYTEKSPAAGIARIGTFLEFTELFGGPPAAKFEVEIDGQGAVADVENKSAPTSYLYYALSHYFKNGGGPCHVVSAGPYTDLPTRQPFDDALDVLRQWDEPTLLVLTDAVLLPAVEYYALCDAALGQCHALMDRFTIIDVKMDAERPKADVDVLRDSIHSPYRAYGAAYYPYLTTTLNYQYDEEDVQIAGPDKAPPRTLASIATTDTALHNRVKARLLEERVELPPSAAVAGVYASVDRDRGVWKAPANVSLVEVIEPIVKITEEEQDLLNVDATSGKSINAIRSFSGKGTLVWGARTLAGNDNEWKYVPVRRLFLMIEESARKATSFAVFEPNDATTWLKVKGMIESFLYGLWERGALAGPTPAAAYFVNVGLGKTMTNRDVLEGVMNVEIGVAAVRPAEFIVLRFSHKMQEA